MKKLSRLVSCLLLIVGAATAQTAQVQVSERLLPQWLTGLIAVSGFLFLTFAVLLVQRAWCGASSRGRSSSETGRGSESVMTNGNTYDTALDMVRSKDDTNADENLVIDSSDDKVTSM